MTSLHGFSLTDLPPIQIMSESLYRQVELKGSLPPLSAKSTYWGAELLLEQLETGEVWKRIDMNAATQSSLEYHVRKEEIYFLLHGELDIGIRIGRAENHTLTMRAGEMFKIKPGLMHMRKAKTDVVLVEWASSDDAKDSHIVEDGKIYKHVNAHAL